MNLIRSIFAVVVTAALVAPSVRAQEYKETYNAAREAAIAKNYATAVVQFAEAANGADAAGDAEIARQARYIAAQLYNRLGNAALKAEDTEDALEHYSSGVAIFPQYIKNTYGQGLSYKLMGRIDEALEIWSGITDNTQDRETARTAVKAIREHFYFQVTSAISKPNPTLGDADRALAVLERSTEFLEPDADYYYYTAVAQLAKGNNAESIAAADQALALHDGSRSDAAKIHYTRGLALIAEGDTEGAKLAFQNAAIGSYRQSAEHYLSTL